MVDALITVLLAAAVFALSYLLFQVVVKFVREAGWGNVMRYMLTGIIGPLRRLTA